MLELDNEVVLHKNPKWKSSIISCLVSLISLLFIQFSLSLLPLFLPISHFIILLPLSALLLVIVVGLGRFCKKVAGVRASAPAFVFFTIFFIWAIYIFVLRQVISSLFDIIFNMEIIMIILGLCRIMSLDPGFVTHHTSSHDLFLQSPPIETDAQEEELKILTSVVHQESQAEESFTRQRRVRYCKPCKNYVIGFDHHCPAFGNCIGQRNHALFLLLLVGFAVAEASYVLSAYQFIAKFQTSNEAGVKAITFTNLVVGSMLFCLIQVVWQVVFIMWHVFCASFNIKTDEWINWRKYPEFQIKDIIPHAGEPQSGVRQRNSKESEGVRFLQAMTKLLSWTKLEAKHQNVHQSEVAIKPTRYVARFLKMLARLAPSFLFLTTVVLIHLLIRSHHPITTGSCSLTHTQTHTRRQRIKLRGSSQER